MSMSMVELSDEIWRDISQGLSPDELWPLSCVSKTLNRIVTPLFLQKLFSNTFGKKQWESFFGDIGEEPPLPSNIKQQLLQSCPFLGHKESVADTSAHPDSSIGKWATANSKIF